ncbi:hypothetical protein CC86DRAFT_366122 [Ophiobolus disseminans]|uniref:Uncharacterized protein n=1 Tax=Ophiobolus disseminans TaxID=1469910 RepID=A0A6A7AHU8_9PLEO|nr:hypothetical protein CC86DRAFT_366122 [Ophiobolus disseminans]
MDEDLIAFGIVMVGFLSMPMILVFSITGCIAYGRTKAWDKMRNQGAINLESSRLVENADDEESDFVDTDDEDDFNKRKAEEESDKSLTFNQKFRKEWKNCWNGKGREEIVKTREREERRKLAKAVARALDRRERRRARLAAQGQADELPPYIKN